MLERVQHGCVWLRVRCVCSFACAGWGASQCALREVWVPCTTCEVPCALCGASRRGSYKDAGRRREGEGDRDGEFICFVSCVGLWGDN